MGVMAPVGKDYVTGGSGQPGVSLLIKGGDTCDPSVWIGFLGDVVLNDEDCGDYPYGFPTTDHREAGKMAS